MSTDVTVACLKYGGSTLDFCRDFCFFPPSEIFKSVYSEVCSIPAQCGIPLSSPSLTFSVLVLSSLAVKNGHESCCVFWMLLVQLWRFRYAEFYLMYAIYSSLSTFTTSLTKATQTTPSMPGYAWIISLIPPSFSLKYLSTFSHRKQRFKTECFSWRQDLIFSVKATSVFGAKRITFFVF